MRDPAAEHGVVKLARLRADRAASTSWWMTRATKTRSTCSRRAAAPHLREAQTRNVQRRQALHLQTLTPASRCRAPCSTLSLGITHSAVSSMCTPPPVAVLGKPPHRCRTHAPAHAFALAAQAKHRYALLVKVRREWEVGRRVNSLLNPERAMPGYMGTGRGVVMANGHFQGARPQPSRVGDAAAARPHPCTRASGSSLHTNHPQCQGRGGPVRPKALVTGFSTTCLRRASTCSSSVLRLAQAAADSVISVPRWIPSSAYPSQPRRPAPCTGSGIGQAPDLRETSCGTLRANVVRVLQ